MDSIFSRTQSKVTSEKLKETNTGVFSMFSKKNKREVVDVKYYKSNLILGLSDAYILIYDIINEKNLYEINDLVEKEMKIVQIEICGQINNIFNEDHLFCLCEKSLAIFSFDRFLLKQNLDLKYYPNPLAFKIEFIKRTIVMVILFKNSILFFFINSDGVPTKVFDLDKLDSITNKNFFLSEKSCIIESKSRIYIIKLDITNKKFYLSTLYKKDLNFFRTEILNLGSSSTSSSNFHGSANTSSTLNTSLGNLNSSSSSNYSSNSSFNMNLSNLNTFEGFKNIEFLKELMITYSELTELYYLVILNKIFVVENSIHEFANSDKDFIIKEKIYKNHPISYFILEDPYIFIFMDNKIHVHFCLDLKKPLEIISLEYTFSLSNSKIAYKRLNQFFKETKANLFNDLIEFNDVFHMNKLRAGRGNEIILNSCQHLLLIYETKNFKLEWIYSRNIETQFSILKKINFVFSCKYLGYYSKLLNQIIKEETENKNYGNIVNFVKAATTTTGSNHLTTNNNMTYMNSVSCNFTKLINNQNSQSNIIGINNKEDNYSVSVLSNQQADKNASFNLDLFKSFYFPSDNFINILNEKFLLKNSIIFLYSLISIKDYAKAKLLLEEVKIDKIFIMVLLKNFVNSKRLLYIMDKIVKKISISENIQEIIIKSYSEHTGILSELQNQNQILIFKERFMLSENLDIQLPDLIEATLIKTEKDLSVFLKGFFNTLIFYRNDLKIYLNKFRRKNLDGEKIVKKFIADNARKNKPISNQTYDQNNKNKDEENNVKRIIVETASEENREEELDFEIENTSNDNNSHNNDEDEVKKSLTYINNAEVRGFLKKESESKANELSNLKNIMDLNKAGSGNLHNVDLDNFEENNGSANELINKLLQSEIELRYLLIENLIFVCNYFSFKSTGNQKYSDNLKLMIKISHNILEKDFINLLQNSDLDEEILLFYYYKGNYSKCLNKIVSIYDSLEKIELQKDFPDKSRGGESLFLEKYESLDKMDIFSNDSNSNTKIESGPINNAKDAQGDNSQSATIINISKPGLHSARFSNNINNSKYDTHSIIDNIKNLKSFSKEIAFEKLGYNTNIEKNVSFINKEALLDKTEENESENTSNPNDNQHSDSISKEAINDSLIKISENASSEQIEKNKNDDFTIKIDDTILKKNSNVNSNKNLLIKENPQLKNIDKIKNQWFIRYINLINLISPKIQKVELMEYMKWALSKNAYKTIDILFENKIISNTKIENDFLEILKPFGIDAVIYYLKFILGNNKVEEPTHQNEIINLYTLKLRLLYESLEKEDPLIRDYNEHFKDCKKKIKKTKSELFYFLLENEKYDLEYAYDSISKLEQLRLENSIILIKLNRLEEAAKSILYCGQSNVIFYIKQIIKKFPFFDLVYLILKDIKANFPNNLKSLYEVNHSFDASIRQIKSHFISRSNTEKLEKKLCDETPEIKIERVFIDVLMEIYDEYELLLQLINLDIFDSLELDGFLEFFKKVFNKIDHEQNSAKIEISLTENKLLNLFEKTREMEMKSFVVDKKSYCRKCSRGFFDSNFVFIFPDILYHTECYETMNFLN